MSGPNIDKPETSSALALTKTPVALSRLDSASGPVMSFDPQTPEGAVKLITATLDELPPLAEQANKELFVTDWFCHPAQSNGEGRGEVQEFTRAVVFDKDGKAYDCGSLGVLKSLDVVRLCRGDRTWNPPVKCTVVVERIAGGRQWMTLRPDVKDMLATLQKLRKKESS